MYPEEHEIPANIPGEAGGHAGEHGEGSGWTTTKQAAKALGVTRRTVQGYVRRRMLVAREEGTGVEKTFYVSIDSLNALLARRRQEAGESNHTANFSEPSPAVQSPANPGENFSAALRRTIERLEARTAEAASLRARLELTERSESTLREDLQREREERRQAQEEAGRLREELDAERSKGFFRRLFGG